MPDQSPIAEIHSDNYRLLQEQVYSQSGIVLGADKHYLFETRLAPILRQLSLASINDLCALLRGAGQTAIARQVVEAMTTNETYFFRDPAHYDAIKTVLLPRLMEERRDTRRLWFWSAAASTGQESYSLAMLLLEEAALQSWNIQILGTDFSSVVLERARSGTYQQIEVNRGLRAALLVKHFRRAGVDWQLSDQVRRMVRFETIDLRKSMRALGPFDLVFCRNVMIYFDAETRKNIMKEIHSTLFRGGWLLIGGAETVFGIDEWFDKQTIGTATVYVAR
jgi:chemotaxis protein methyltransferase CheR